MRRLEVSGAVRPIYGSLGVKRIIKGMAPVKKIAITVFNNLKEAWIPKANEYTSFRRLQCEYCDSC